MDNKQGEHKHLPDAELEIMRIVWAAGTPVSSGDIYDRITPHGKWARTTVLNFLARLQNRGFVGTYKQGKCNVYTATVDENDYMQQECSAMFQGFYGGSVTAMISLLYETGTIDNEDLADLSVFIANKLKPPGDELEKSGAGRWQSWYKRHFQAQQL